MINNRREGITITVVGDAGSGKTSLISSRVSDIFTSSVPKVLQPVVIPGGDGKNALTLSIVDTPSGDSPKIAQERAYKIVHSDAIILTACPTRPATLLRVVTHWLPYLEEELDVKKPIVLALTQTDKPATKSIYFSFKSALEQYVQGVARSPSQLNAEGEKGRDTFSGERTAFTLGSPSAASEGNIPTSPAGINLGSASGGVGNAGTSQLPTPSSQTGVGAVLHNSTPGGILNQTSPLESPTCGIENDPALESPDYWNLQIMDLLSPYIRSQRIDSCILTSAKTFVGLSEVFQCAQQAVLDPLAPLYDVRTKSLTAQFVRALQHIFRVFDADCDGILRTTELAALQMLCFGKQETSVFFAGLMSDSMQTSHSLQSTSDLDNQPEAHDVLKLGKWQIGEGHDALRAILASRERTALEVLIDAMIAVSSQIPSALAANLGLSDNNLRSILVAKHKSPTNDLSGLYRANKYFVNPYPKSVARGQLLLHSPFTTYIADGGITFPGFCAMIKLLLEAPPPARQLRRALVWTILRRFDYMPVVVFEDESSRGDVPSGSGTHSFKGLRRYVAMIHSAESSMLALAPDILINSSFTRSPSVTVPDSPKLPSVMMDVAKLRTAQCMALGASSLIDPSTVRTSAAAECKSNGGRCDTSDLDLDDVPVQSALLSPCPQAAVGPSFAHLYPSHSYISFIQSQATQIAQWASSSGYELDVLQRYSFSRQGVSRLPNAPVPSSPPSIDGEHSQANPFDSARSAIDEARAAISVAEQDLVDSYPGTLRGSRDAPPKLQRGITKVTRHGGVWSSVLDLPQPLLSDQAAVLTPHAIAFLTHMFRTFDDDGDGLLSSLYSAHYAPCLLANAVREIRSLRASQSLRTQSQSDVVQGTLDFQTALSHPAPVYVTERSGFACPFINPRGSLHLAGVSVTAQTRFTLSGGVAGIYCLPLEAAPNASRTHQLSTVGSARRALLHAMPDAPGLGKNFVRTQEIYALSGELERLLSPLEPEDQEVLFPSSGAIHKALATALPTILAVPTSSVDNAEAEADSVLNQLHIRALAVARRAAEFAVHDEGFLTLEGWISRWQALTSFAPDYACRLMCKLGYNGVPIGVYKELYGAAKTLEPFENVNRLVTAARHAVLSTLHAASRFQSMVQQRPSLVSTRFNVAALVALHSQILVTNNKKEGAGRASDASRGGTTGKHHHLTPELQSVVVDPYDNSQVSSYSAAHESDLELPQIAVVPTTQNALSQMTSDPQQRATGLLGTTTGAGTAHSLLAPTSFGVQRCIGITAPREREALVHGFLFKNSCYALVVGSPGCGKTTLVRSLAKRQGMHSNDIIPELSTDRRYAPEESAFASATVFPLPETPALLTSLKVRQELSASLAYYDSEHASRDTLKQATAADAALAQFFASIPPYSAVSQKGAKRSWIQTWSTDKDTPKVSLESLSWSGIENPVLGPTTSLGDAPLNMPLVEDFLRRIRYSKTSCNYAPHFLTLREVPGRLDDVAKIFASEVLGPFQKLKVNPIFEQALGVSPDEDSAEQQVTSTTVSAQTKAARALHTASVAAHAPIGRDGKFQAGNGGRVDLIVIMYDPSNEASISFALSAAALVPPLVPCVFLESKADLASGSMGGTPPQMGAAISSTDHLVEMVAAATEAAAVKSESTTLSSKETHRIRLQYDPSLILPEVAKRANEKSSGSEAKEHTDAKVIRVPFPILPVSAKHMTPLRPDWRSLQPGATLSYQQEIIEAATAFRGSPVDPLLFSRLLAIAQQPRRFAMPPPTSNISDPTIRHDHTTSGGASILKVLGYLALAGVVAVGVTTSARGRRLDGQMLQVPRKAISESISYLRALFTTTIVPALYWTLETLNLKLPSRDKTSQGGGNNDRR